MNTTHPYLRYAQALLLAENNLSQINDITFTHIAVEIENGFNSFRVKPKSTFIAQNSVEYSFVQAEKGDTPNGVYLSPNVISTDKLTKNIWSEGHKLLQETANNPKDKLNDLKMSIAPISGEYLSFFLVNERNSSERSDSLKFLFYFYAHVKFTCYLMCCHKNR